MFAKNHATYPNGPHDGQVVVKESWIPEAVAAPDAAFSPRTWRPATTPVITSIRMRARDGGVYRAGRARGAVHHVQGGRGDRPDRLGWVYATVSPAGKLTSAGRVAALMGCHETAEHERLFGVPLSPSF